MADSWIFPRGYNIPPLRNKKFNWVHNSGFYKVSNQLLRQKNSGLYTTDLRKNMNVSVEGVYKSYPWPQALTSLCNISCFEIPSAGASLATKHRDSFRPRKRLN